MTHPFTTDEADYRWLCEAARAVLEVWQPYMLEHPMIRDARRSLGAALLRCAVSKPPGRRVLIDGRECTLVELEEGR